MGPVYERCCGLDVHKKTVVACVRTPGHAETRTFGTMTRDVLALADWLTECGVTHVAMESTGVYWKPIYNILEGNFTLLVVNAQHLKVVPGRKTDVKDAEWIAQLLQHGLLRGSFIPDREQRDLRDLTRHRTSLVRDRARVVQRIQKVLEDTNLKLTSVATDIVGLSARAMLERLLSGERDPAVLAGLAKGRLRQKRQDLETALEGVLRPHHRFLLTELLAQLDYLEEAVESVSKKIEEYTAPSQKEIDLLDTIPGINRTQAETLLAEVGADVSRFPTASHLASWAGLCPGNDESAGKHRSGKIRKGSPWLRTALVEAAHGAARTRNTYLGAQYRRLAARRGRKKALVAIAHSLLLIVYHVLTNKEPYLDLGSNYFDERERLRVEKRLSRRLERLGYKVTLEPMESAA
jgi:transposase